jgi:hypothetical protein
MVTTSLEQMKIFVIPDWIYRNVIRNKLNIIDIADYSKIRSIFSIDDMAEWFYLNDKLKIDDIRISNEWLDCFWHSISPSQLTEVRNSVLPLSGSEEIAHSAKLRLTKDSNLSKSTYKFIVINNILYIILSEGFITHIQNPANKLDFVKNYLKECYAMASVSEVAKLSIFDLYLKQL